MQPAGTLGSLIIDGDYRAVLDDSVRTQIEDTSQPNSVLLHAICINREGSPEPEDLPSSSQ